MIEIKFKKLFKKDLGVFRYMIIKEIKLNSIGNVLGIMK